MSSKLVRAYYKKRNQFYYWKIDMLNKLGFFTYAVIVEVPDPTKEGGNLASATFAMPEKGFHDSDLYLENNSYNYRNGELIDADRKPYPVTYDDMHKVLKGKKGYNDLSFMVPVFELGEIVILTHRGGREVDGKQRKPSKWFVEVEEYRSLPKAVARSREVINAEYKKRYGSGVYGGGKQKGGQ